MIRTFRLLAPKTLAGKLFLLAQPALLLATLAACGGSEPAATAPTPTEAAAVAVVVAPTPTAPYSNISDIAATGAAIAPTPAGLRPEYGGTINYSTGAIGTAVDPWHILSSATTTGSNYLWNNSPIQMKFPYDPTKGVEYEPGLATEWSTSADGTKWTLKLRQGVPFHDGEVFNADDVVATMQRALDPKFLMSILQVPMRQIFVGVKKVDDYTVVYDTGALPNATAFAYLSTHYMAIVPEHLIRGVDPTSTDVEKRWKRMGPKPGESGTLNVGTGPFKQVTWNADVELVGERNPNYWKFDEFGGRLPYLDRIVFAAVPDPTRRLAHFAAGVADYSLGAAAGLHPDKAKQQCGTTRDKDCYTYQFPHGVFAQILNHTNTEPFKDPKVVLASRYAQDMDEIFRLSYGGRQGYMWMDRGRFPDTALNVKEQYELLPWSDPARRPEFVQKAKDLMAEAGHAKGFNLPFPIFSARLCSGSFLDEYSRHVDQWDRVGIRGFLECRQGVLIDDELKAGRWSINGPGRNIAIIDPGFMVIRYALEDSGAIADLPWKYEGREELDALYRKTVKTIDTAKRNESYREMERYMTNTKLTIYPSGYSTVFMAVHGCVHNFQAGGSWESYAWSHEKTWLSGDCKK